MEITLLALVLMFTIVFWMGFGLGRIAGLISEYLARNTNAVWYVPSDEEPPIPPEAPHPDDILQTPPIDFDGDPAETAGPQLIRLG